MAYNLLSEPIKRYIYDQKWDTLRPIQVAAIKNIIATDNNYILASRTASGKTEAAFLPILSSIDSNEVGVQVLYISPLIALINDQVRRVEDLCKYIDMPVTKWHGEASISLKNKILNEPRGVMLITPESLEAMFVTKPYNIDRLFSNLKFIIIDEIHSFIGKNRGVQLKSILFRLQKRNKISARIIGLSATIGDYNEAKLFTGNENKTKVLLDRDSKSIITTLKYYYGENKDELPIELIKDMYKHVHDSKVLIFPNSRGRVEEIAVKLKRISKIVGGHNNFFTHHSSIHKDVREYVEFFAKNNNNQNFTVSCTSTLELGIDIGTIDEVIQVDATHSISSMIQRVGRSGRKDGTSSKLTFYTTTPWNMLQALSCWSLNNKSYIEPPEIINRPYDILVHQILSIIKGYSGIDYITLIRNISENFGFKQIKENEIIEVIAHLIQINFIEKIDKELIIGIDGEKLVNNRDFYSTFEKEINLKVINNNRTIGELPFSIQIEPNNNIFLSAKIWKITEVDLKANKIYVTIAKDGKKPIFFGSSANIHPSIHLEMFNILNSNLEYDILDVESQNVLTDLRNSFSPYKIKNIKTERAINIHPNKTEIFIFAGSRVAYTLSYLFSVIGYSSISDNNLCSLLVYIPEQDEFYKQWKSLLLLERKIDDILLSELDSNPNRFNITRWSKYLPNKFKVSLIKESLYDFEGAFKFIEETRFIP